MGGLIPSHKFMNLHRVHYLQHRLHWKGAPGCLPFLEVPLGILPIPLSSCQHHMHAHQHSGNIQLCHALEGMLS